MAKSSSKPRVKAAEPKGLQRLTKRVVEKPDGRYLIYFEKK